MQTMLVTGIDVSSTLFYVSLWAGLGAQLSPSPVFPLIPLSLQSESQNRISLRYFPQLLRRYIPWENHRLARSGSCLAQICLTGASCSVA